MSVMETAEPWWHKYRPWVRVDERGVLDFTADDKGKEELADEPQPGVVTKTRAAGNTENSKTSNYISHMGGGNVEKLKARMMTILKLPYKADAARRARELTTWLREKWYPANPKWDPTVDEVVHGVLVNGAEWPNWRRVLFPTTKEEDPSVIPRRQYPQDADTADDQGEQTKARKVKNDPVSRTKNYITLWGGGKTELRKRLKEHLDIGDPAANAILYFMERWLKEVWYPATKEWEDPTLEQVLAGLPNFKFKENDQDEGRGLDKYLNDLFAEEKLETWKTILRYEVPKKKERKPKEKLEEVETPWSYEKVVRKKEVKVTLGRIRHGNYNLSFSLRHRNRYEGYLLQVGAGVKDWDPDQPIAFLTDLHNTEIEVSKTLRKEVVAYLGIDAKALRVVVPSIFQGPARHLGLDARTLISFEAKSNDPVRFPSLQFLPLDFRNRMGNDREFPSDINFEQMRGHIFTLKEHKYTTTKNKKPVERVQRGRIAIVQLIPRNAPQFRVALAFYYQTSPTPELVGVYVYKPRENQPAGAAEDDVSFTPERTTYWENELPPEMMPDPADEPSQEKSASTSDDE